MSAQEHTHTQHHETNTAAGVGSSGGAGWMTARTVTTSATPATSLGVNTQTGNKADCTFYTFTKRLAQVLPFITLNRHLITKYTANKIFQAC